MLKEGHGASLGSFTKNMHDIIYEDLTFMGTDCGFRLKSNRDRSGDVYNIIFRNCNMFNVASPFVITSWYDKIPETPQAAAASPDELLETTPRFHGVLLQNVRVMGYAKYSGSKKNLFGIFIYGRPEAPVKDITFDNVQITHGKGIKMNFCEDIKFTGNCSFAVKNTNKTSKNAVADKDLENVMEERFEGSYTWKGNTVK
jgi:polygalacturonase